MRVKKIYLLNADTVRIITTHETGDTITDIPYDTISMMDADKFITWAVKNIKPPVVVKIPSWFADLEGTKIK